MFLNAPEWLEYVGPISMGAAVFAGFFIVRIQNRKARERAFSIKGKSRSVSI